MNQDYTLFRNRGSQYTTRNLKYPDSKEVEGRRREKTLVDWILIVGSASLILYFAWGCTGSVRGLASATPLPDPCTLTDVICEGEAKEPIKEAKKIKAYVTEYNKESSCHYPDGRGGCKTASGAIARLGMVACPRTIALESQVIIGGEHYVCADRYAEWVDVDRGLPTFDVWTDGSTEEALAFGLQIKEVEIIE
jgi:hypothetical protein